MKIEITLTPDSGKTITLTPGEVEELRKALDIDKAIKLPVIFPDYYPDYPTTPYPPLPGDGGTWVSPWTTVQPEWQSRYKTVITVS